MKSGGGPADRSCGGEVPRLGRFARGEERELGSRQITKKHNDRTEQALRQARSALPEDASEADEGKLSRPPYSSASSAACPPGSTSEPWCVAAQIPSLVRFRDASCQNCITVHSASL